MFHHELKLDSSSYHLNSKPSPSRVSVSSVSPSQGESESAHDIFQAKTRAEISINYQKLWHTYGKWNADKYLEILKELNPKDEQLLLLPLLDLLPELTKAECQDNKRTTVHLDQQSTSKYKYVMDDCKLYQTDPPKLAHVQEDSILLPEPTYKKIFKNARLKRTPRNDEDSLTFTLTSSSSGKIEKSCTAEKEPSEKNFETPKTRCELLKNHPNNYLLDLRRSKSEKDNKKVSFGSAAEVCVDDIERYYVNKRMQAVLETNLDNQIQLVRATLKSHVSDISGVDLLKDAGYQELKDRCLDDEHNINEFQKMFDDLRWRKKFDLGQIEESDDANSLDVSDIASSESASMCSGDSLGTELDYKPKPIQPSRIPCITEIRDMGDILFDKISMKWEKAIKKNFIDSNSAPIFRHFSHAVRLRSTAPVYSDVLKLLEPHEVYSKMYTPHRIRMDETLEKMQVAQKAKDELIRERRALESYQTRRDLGRKSSSLVRFTPQGPTNRENQRHRLEQIMRVTTNRGQDGSTNWTKRALAEDYANLKPILQTKKTSKDRPSAINEPTTHSLRKLPKQTSYPNLTTLPKSFWNMEASLFLKFPPLSSKPAPRLRSPSRSKLVISSRSKVRMPI